jgi:uncharacterized phage protein (TIGR01671 family)
MIENKYKAWNKRLKIMEEVISLEWYENDEGEKHLDVTTCRATVGDKLILMQYTGQKDKNNKEGYERDIVKTSYGELFEIIWDDEFARFALKDCKDGCHYDLTKEKMSKLEIVGNSFENPELLENG